MHRSSESIGTIAAALAKAQVELTNPEKSLVGTIPGMTPKGNRSFRYAPSVERARPRAQEPWTARDRDRADDRDRCRGRACPPHHRPRPFVRRVGFIRLAGVPGQRNRFATAD